MEVYIPLKGSAKLVVGDEEWQLEPGTMARVGASEMRKILPGADGVQLLCLGGTSGQAFEVQAWSEPGGPIPEVPNDEAAGSPRSDARGDCHRLSALTAR